MGYENCAQSHVWSGIANGNARRCALYNLVFWKKICGFDSVIVTLEVAGIAVIVLSLCSSRIQCSYCLNSKKTIVTSYEHNCTFIFRKALSTLSRTTSWFPRNPVLLEEIIREICLWYLIPEGRVIRFCWNAGLDTVSRSITQFYKEATADANPSQFVEVRSLR